MGTRYNRIAGEGVERLAALSDGVFAVAMTLPGATPCGRGLSGTTRRPNGIARSNGASSSGKRYAVGAALGAFSSHAGISFIVLVQPNSAIAPRLGFLSRL
jgi:hypothetical protein